MEVIVLGSEAYEQIKKEVIITVKKAIRDIRNEALAHEDPAKDWLTREEAQQLLGIRSKTKLQELRDFDEIVYSKAGKVIRYSKKSILEYLDRNIVTYNS